MNKLKRIGAMMAFALLSVLANAQDVTASNDPMRANGKIYVVMAVVVVIVLGLFIYLITLDRKMSRLEKKG